MKILYDLVTVIEERYTFAKVYLSKVTEKSGRLYIASMHKSGNLPFLLVQNLRQQRTKIVRQMRSQIFRQIV